MGAKSEFEATYLGIEAHLGITKHGGSVSATRELIGLCRIRKDSCVLDVGCGVGATACYLAKKIGCRVVGVDIRKAMVVQAKERGAREGVADGVAFGMADAQNLPFEDGIFDAVISESVILFVEDRQKALAEYVRVAKPGGYVGLNEEIWLKTPVPTKVAEYMKYAIELSGDIPAFDFWEGMVKNAGLQNVVVQTHKHTRLREFSRLWRYGLGDLARATYRMVILILKRPEVRRWIRLRACAPLGIVKYLGYGIYVGRK